MGKKRRNGKFPPPYIYFPVKADLFSVIVSIKFSASFPSYALTSLQWQQCFCLYFFLYNIDLQKCNNCQYISNRAPRYSPSKRNNHLLNLRNVSRHEATKKYLVKFLLNSLEVITFQVSKPQFWWGGNLIKRVNSMDHAPRPPRQIHHLVITARTFLGRKKTLSESVRLFIGFKESF